MRGDLPSGTVTFLFTDVEGSTMLLHDLGALAYAAALAEHRRLIREACASEGGVEVDTQGDAFFFAFPTASGALAAAQHATESLADGPIQVRIGLHTGTPLITDEGYIGDDVHFAARVAASGHGRQILVSSSTAALIGASGSEPLALSLLDLGEHRLKDIEGPVSIFQLGDGSFPPLKSISNTNLPRPASFFVGREQELAEVLAKIEAGARLLTLTGPGGSGKTRLALEAAASLVPEYRAGVFWVGLAALREPALVAETIAQTLGAKDGLQEHIGERELLLLLDNLEQVIEAAPELSALLSACPHLALLVTSRELLRVHGEVEYPVPPLADIEAVSLFCERSQLDPSDEIAELCRRLDSLPLAVELAAARAKVFSPAQILERLSQRLDLLKGGRDADPRQQTLRATIEWSYDLLSADDQRLFRRLAVFAGGSTFEAAEEVVGADPDTLQSLLEKNLLRRRDADLGPRFWMLETIREFAAERLAESGETEETRRKHAEWFLALAEEHEPTLMGTLDESSILSLRAEIDNLRTAIEFLSTLPDPTGELRLVGALFRFWEAGGLVVEGQRSADRALVRSTREYDPRLRLKVLYAASICAGHQGDWQNGMRYDQERLGIARTADDERMVAAALHDLGIDAISLGDLESGMAFYEESRVRAARIGDNEIVASVMNNLADAALTRRDYASARAFAEEAIALTTPADSWKVHPESNLAFALLGLGEVELAAEKFRDTIELVRKVLGPVYAAMTLDGLAAVAAARGEFVRAARLLGSAQEVRDRGSFLADGSNLELAEQTVRAGREALGDEIWGVEYAHGAAMSLDEAVAYAREEPPDP